MMIDDEVGATTEQIDRTNPFGDRVLLVIDGANLQALPLPSSGTLTIGRASKCDVVIDSGSVSRHHANLVIGATDVEIEDAGSSNGTFIDGSRLATGTRMHLTIGVPFLIGAVTVMVQTRTGQQQRTPSPKSSAIAALEQSASRIAMGKLNLIITGESGVGKGRFGERIHDMSPRRSAPFSRVNCAAISETLLEMELFGTDLPNRPGVLETAEGGTVFLQDVDLLPDSLQQKILRVFEDGALRRVNSVRARPVDVRFIASSSRDLQSEVDSGKLRHDLYFRLAGATFAIPPLRDRRDEIIPLAEQFIAFAAGPLGRSFVIGEEAKQWLEGHDWPGNIRELRNACERAVLLATGAMIERHHLTVEDPAKRPGGPGGQRFRSSATIPPPLGLPASAPTAADMPSQVRATVAELEKQRILEALDKCAGNQTRAAEMLGISRRTLINRLDEYGIARPRKRDE